MTPFRTSFRLSVGDFVAKTLNFAVFVYLARVLGVAEYGVLELARAVLVYFALLADGGLEVWATRRVAAGGDIRQLVGRIVPLRCVLALLACAMLIALLPLLPDYPALRPLLGLFGLTLTAQALSLKWVFMGQEHMTAVAGGLVLAQVTFAVAVFGIVRSPDSLILVPIFQLAGELAIGGYFAWHFARTQGGLRIRFTFQGAGQELRPALTIGATQGLGLVNYNFASLLLGLLWGPMAVGWYGAAYKPVTMVLTVPVTYFAGLFPGLARSFVESGEAFRSLVRQSLRLASIVALPIGVGGTFLAGPIIALLFGDAYSNSVPALQVLAWTATLVILRTTYRQAFNAAGRPGADLACAALASTVNVGLNVLWIPRYGLVGAAAATLVADTVWLGALTYCCSRLVAGIGLATVLVRPGAGALVMAAFLWFAEPLPWILRAFAALFVYGGVLVLCGERGPGALWHSQPVQTVTERP